MRIQGTAIIRDRGQLTIPEKVRKVQTWISPASVVTITSENPDEIVIRPYSSKNVDWDKLWKMIRKSRSIKGKRGNLSEFIARDRYSH
ncbi:hypothetical protein A3F02_03435 [Candidatus Curtissbacteria bacterium RIFCSPHIGHO2_12_FULL_38_9b]|uniref:Uncharacterized protein n=2 Tax=Candidatus Curtissiibacteriota TaxID=1752717 RepID=A0A1F5GZL5_9BACT|nr:MAG: hypothetical protein A3A48_00045 [Candidatus Curtissbacteria bacterium RIFCSPLOWO2_01_FULL_37_9]OGD97336.1 MAG: hypothetical protein A3F02_03435 [Candidatus Curtissbacteria bacterium RIFCSPHIGHO2_12_FULL_38_9b]